MAKRYYNSRSQDSGMIKEDRSAIANLPQESIIKSWPEVPSISFDLDDTQAVINNQIREDVSSKDYKKGKFTEKY